LSGRAQSTTRLVTITPNIAKVFITPLKGLKISR
jgi:hypothetical protein